MKSAVVAMAVFVVVLVPSTASACACCTEPGSWRDWSIPLSEFLEKFDREPALLRADMRGVIEMNTVDGVVHRDSVTIEFRGTDFEFRERRTGLAVARIMIDDTVGRFVVDTHDQDEPYVEWRFTGTVAPLDDVHTYWLGPTATLVIQGRQNNCFEAHRMTHWIANFDGPGAVQTYITSYGTADMGYRTPAPGVEDGPAGNH